VSKQSTFHKVSQTGTTAVSVHIALGFCHNFQNIQIFMVYGCSGVHSSLPSVTKGMMQISVHMIRLNQMQHCCAY
jgi:hypothetical protein